MQSSPCPILSIPVFLLIILITASLGRRLLLIIKVTTCSPLECWLFSTALGLGTFAYLVLAAGISKLLYWWAIAIVLALMGLICFRQSFSALRDTINGLKHLSARNIGLWDLLTIGSSLVVAGLALVAALAPPSISDWDGLAYHLAVPKMYLRHHSIFYVPFISHSNFPFLTEMLYTVGLGFGSTALAKLFHYAMYVIGALGILCICRRHVNPLAGTLGALIFICVPLNVWEAGIAYADLTTAAYILLAVYALLNWEKEFSNPWLIMAGLMGGFALGTKALAIIPVVTLCAWVFIAALRRNGVKTALHASSLLCMVALVVGSPWYIKTYVYTGNPVYPFLYNIFGGKYWSSEAAHSYRNAQLEFGMGRGLGQFVMLPWNITMIGSEFYDKGAVVLFGLIGPAFLGFLGILAFQRSLTKPVVKSLLVAAIFTVCWFFLMQSSRYLLSVIPLLCIAAGSSASYAITEWRIARYFAVLLLILCVVIGAFTGTIAEYDCGRVVLGLESADEYLSRTLSIYAAEKSINENTPPNARIVLYDEVRGFYLDREYIWGNPGHHEIIPYNQLKNGDDLIDWLMNHGYTHAMINWRIAGGSTEGHRRLLYEAIESGRMAHLDTIHNVGIYEFRKNQS